MVTKTPRGFVRKEITGDGRESGDRWVERETFMRKQTKTKKKRVIKSENELLNMIKNS